MWEEEREESEVRSKSRGVGTERLGRRRGGLSAIRSPEPPEPNDAGKCC